MSIGYMLSYAMLYYDMLCYDRHLAEEHDALAAVYSGGQLLGGVVLDAVAAQVEDHERAVRL